MFGNVIINVEKYQLHQKNKQYVIAASHELGVENGKLKINFPFSVFNFQLKCLCVSAREKNPVKNNSFSTGFYLGDSVSQSLGVLFQICVSVQS